MVQILKQTVNISEIDRVAETTKFNETYLLKGDEKSATKSSYITNYSVTITRNMVSNAADENVMPYKVKYNGTNNIYIASAECVKSRNNNAYATTVVQQGDDITDYLSYIQTVYNDVNAEFNRDYAAFISCELDSKVGTLGDGISDIYIDSTDGKVKANSDMFFYDTSNSTIKAIQIGDDISEYLNDDYTVKNNYRFVDILDGPGAYTTSTTVSINVPNSNVVNSGNGSSNTTNSNLTSTGVIANNAVTNVYYYNGNNELVRTNYNAGDEINESLNGAAYGGKYGFKIDNAHLSYDATTGKVNIPANTIVMVDDDLYAVEQSGQSVDKKSLVNLVNIKNAQWRQVWAGNLSDYNDANNRYCSMDASLYIMTPYTDYTNTGTGMTSSSTITEPTASNTTSMSVYLIQNGIDKNNTYVTGDTVTQSDDGSYGYVVDGSASIFTLTGTNLNVSKDSTVLYNNKLYKLAAGNYDPDITLTSMADGTTSLIATSDYTQLSVMKKYTTVTVPQGYTTQIKEIITAHDRTSQRVKNALGLNDDYNWEVVLCQDLAQVKMRYSPD